METKTELFPDTLPPWATRAAGIVVIFIFTAVLIASLLLRFPESVRCPFVIVPTAGANPIQSPVRGVIVRVNVYEGMIVRKGEPLFVIRSREISERAVRLNSLEKELRLGLELILTRKILSRENHEISVRIQQTEIENLETHLGSLGKGLALHRDIVRRMKELPIGAVSQLDLARQQLYVAEGEAELERGKASISMARLKLNKIGADRQKEEAQEEIDIRKYETKLRHTLASLKELGREISAYRISNFDLEDKWEDQDFNDTEAPREVDPAASGGHLMRVVAPFSGTVLSVARKNRRDVVEHGQELCQLARMDGGFRAEMTVPEKYIAKLAPGQPAKMLFTAFPYERYGVREGRVTWISPGAVDTGAGKGFRAFVELLDGSLLINGVERPLQVGMRGEARVVVGRRTLIEFVLDPLRKIREHMRDVQQRGPVEGESNITDLTS